jgi:protein-tyrosine phosphatase
LGFIEKMKILFVCLGNICRSPLAEAVFNHKVKIKGLDKHFVADSCGTANYHVGDPPDPRTIKNAHSNGITITHQGRQFHESDLTTFDLILAMDENNLRSIHRHSSAESASHKIRLLRAYDPVGTNEAVPDPYYGTEKDFQEVFDIINRSVDGLLASLTANRSQ